MSSELHSLSHDVNTLAVFVHDDNVEHVLNAVSLWCRPGAVVASMAWNGYRHMECWSVPQLWLYMSSKACLPASLTCGRAAPCPNERGQMGNMPCTAVAEARKLPAEACCPPQKPHPPFPRPLMCSCFYVHGCSRQLAH